jgi:NADPH:quinone reductase-like Zn-dependent oxidoreductase
VGSAAVVTSPEVNTHQATMKAAVRDRYGSPDVLTVCEIDIPRPAPDQVLVRVHAASVNAADWHIMRGRPVVARPMMGGVRRPTPGPLGTDVAGVVEAVGSEVTQLAKGDEVFGSVAGGFAEYVVGRVFVRKPANLGFEEAAAIPVAACTALQAVRDKGELKAGQRVLVNGAGGGVGSYSVQIARALGAGHITATSRAENFDMLRALGADDVIDYTREDFTRSPRRFDLIVDLGGTRSLGATRRALSAHGTLVIVGGSKSSLAVVSRMAAAAIRSKLLGQRMVAFTASITKTDLQTLSELAEQGQLRTVVDSRYTLSAIGDALRRVGSGRAGGKVVVALR